MDTNQVKNLIRVGRVSSVNGAECSARVTFGDKDDLVSAELPVITFGSRETRAYWVPEIDTQVLCVFDPNVCGSGLSAGFIIGAYYSDEDVPAESDADVRSITFADGSFIRYSNGNIEINAKGNLVLKGANITLN